MTRQLLNKNVIKFLKCNNPCLLSLIIIVIILIFIIIVNVIVIISITTIVIVNVKIFYVMFPYLGWNGPTVWPCGSLK